MRATSIHRPARVSRFATPINDGRRLCPNGGETRARHFSLDCKCSRERFAPLASGPTAASFARDSSYPDRRGDALHVTRIRFVARLERRKHSRAKEYIVRCIIRVICNTTRAHTKTRDYCTTYTHTHTYVHTRVRACTRTTREVHGNRSRKTLE